MEETQENEYGHFVQTTGDVNLFLLDRIIHGTWFFMEQ